MPVRAPAADANVHFHVAGLRRLVSKLQNRAAKIRPAFDADKTRMKHAHRFAVQRAQFIPSQPLMQPDGLEQALRRGIAIVAEREGGAGAESPLRVAIGRMRGHLGLLLRRCSRKVNLDLIGALRLF